MDVRNRGKVEILAPDVRCQRVEKDLARLDVAGNRTCLDQGGTLPVLTEALVVLQRSLGRESDVC